MSESCDPAKPGSTRADRLQAEADEQAPRAPSRARRLRLLLDGERAVALFEAAKGLLVVLVGFGLLAALGRDVQDIAERLLRHLHLNPARHFPHIFLQAAAKVSDRQLLGLAALAVAYALLRWAEAWGLWHRRRWAEWLAVGSGAIYMPYELRALLHRPTLLEACTFAINLAIVVYMALVLRRKRASAQPVG